MKYLISFRVFEGATEKAAKRKDIIKSSPINEELGGLGVLALVGAAIAGPGLYTSAKQLWSKHITSKKYEKTGKTEKVIKTDGNTQIIDEYIGKDGKIYWGYDHLWSPDTFANPEEAKASLDLYTAIFNEEDLPRLKKFITGIKVKYINNNIWYFIGNIYRYRAI